MTWSVTGMSIVHKDVVKWVPLNGFWAKKELLGTVLLFY